MEATPRVVQCPKCIALHRGPSNDTGDTGGNDIDWEVFRLNDDDWKALTMMAATVTATASTSGVEHDSSDDIDDWPETLLASSPSSEAEH